MKLSAISVTLSFIIMIYVPLVAQDDLEEVSFSLFHNNCESVVKFGDYAYIGGEFGLHVVDISDPASPVFVNCLRGDGLAYIDISEASELPRLYSRTGTSLKILDISDRENPVVVGEYQTNLGIIKFFDVVGNYAYIAAESSYYNWHSFIEVVDVSDPTAPIGLSYTVAHPFVLGLDAVGTRVYTSFDVDLNPTGAQVFDASDPFHIQLMGTCEFNYFTTGDVAPYEDYIYIASWDGILIVDIYNLDNPFDIEPYPLWGYYILRVFDHYLFAFLESEIYVLDVIDPINPALLSCYRPLYNVSNIFWENDILYHSADGYSPRSVSGMNIVDYSDAYNPRLIGRHEIPGAITSLHISDNIAYVGTGFTGMFPVDISHPYNPMVGDNVDTESTVKDVFVSGHYAYLAEGNDGLVIFDISIPESPELVGSYIASDATRRVYVEGDYAYLINARDVYYDFRIVIVDISDPEDPLFVNAYDELDAPRHIRVNNNIAYISTIQSLEITDMSDPLSPIHLASHPYRESAYDLDFESDLIYVAGWPTGLQIFDVSSPDDPTLIGEFDSFPAYDVAVNGELACLTNYYGVYLLDVSNPAEPILISSYEDEVIKNEIVMENEFVYIAAEDCLVILRITPTGLEEAGVINPNSLSLFQNYPNPFNPSTTIKYALPEQSDVRIEIYNILGQRVATLFDDYRPAGNHSITWQGDDYPSGVYFARMTANNGSKKIKMLLLK